MSGKTCCWSRVDWRPAPPRAAWPNWLVRRLARPSDTPCAGHARLRKTRILVTESILSRMILDDRNSRASQHPVRRVSQRSLDGDFGLALALDVQARCA
jgi:hypothetical protein